MFLTDCDLNLWQDGSEAIVAKGNSGDFVRGDLAMNKHCGECKGQRILRLRRRLGHPRKECCSLAKGANVDLRNLIG